VDLVFVVEAGLFSQEVVAVLVYALSVRVCAGVCVDGAEFAVPGGRVVLGHEGGFAEVYFFELGFFAQGYLYNGDL
jgi:hypothetical protein